MLSRNRLVTLIAAALLAVSTGRGLAERVTFELVSAREPDKLVSELVKNSESGYGGFVATDWGRCFTVDGRPLFVTETMRISLEKGGKKDEKPRGLEAGAKQDEEFKTKGVLRDERGDVKVQSSAKLDLVDGVHTIEPGMHRFRLKGEEIQTDDPDLLVKGTTVKVLCPSVKIFSTEGEKYPQWTPQKIEASYRGQHLLDGTQFRRYVPEYRAYFNWEKGPETKFLFLNLFMVPNPKADEVAPYKFFGRDVWVSQKAVHIDEPADPAARTELAVSEENPLSLVMRRGVGPDPVRRIAYSWERGEGDHWPSYELPDGVTMRGEFRIIQTSPDADIEYPVTIRSRSAIPRKIRFGIRGDFSSFPYRASVLGSSGPPEVPDRFFLAELSSAVVSPRTPVNARLNVYPDEGKYKVTKASFSAVLRPDADVAHQLPVKLTRTGKSSEIYTLQVPALKRAGRYDLVFTCRADRDISLEMPVLGLPNRGAGSATLFTDGNRNTYFQDETIEVNLCVQSPKPVPAGKLVVLLHGKEVMQHPVAPCPKGRTTRTFIVVPRLLKPGKYTFTLRMGDLNVYDLPIRISTTVERTEYASMTTGMQCGTSLSTPYFPTRYHMADFCHLPYAHVFSPVIRQSARDAYAVADSRFNPRLADLIGDDADAPAPERTYTPPIWEMSLAKFTADGVHVYPTVLSCAVEGYSMPHTLKIDLEVMTRWMQMYMQRIRRYSACKGMLFSWLPSTGWKPMDIDGVSMNPDYRFYVRKKKVESEFRAAGGVIPRGSHKWLKEAANPPGERDEKFLDQWRDQMTAWERCRNELYPRTFKVWQDACRRIVPDWTCMSGPMGRWAHGGGYLPADFHRHFDIAAITNVHDQEEEPLMFPFSIDYGGAGIVDKPIWIYSTENASRPAEVRNTFLSLAAGAKGIAYSRGFESDFGTNNSGPGRNEYHRWLLQFLNRYGPYIRTLRPRKEVAILASFVQSSATDGFPYSLQEGQVWALYHDLWHLGYHPDIVVEDDIASGRLSDYRVLFLVGLTWRLAPAVMARLEEFKKAGGRVFRDETTSEVLGGTPLGVKYNSRAGRDNDHYVEWKRMLEGYLQNRDAVLELTRGAVHPVATYDSPFLIAGTMLGPDSKCLLLVNNTPPADGEKKRYGPKYMYKICTLPTKEKIYLDRHYVVYDMLDNERVELAKDERGHHFTAEFNRIEGRAYCLLERPIEKLSVETAREIRARRDIPLQAWLSDSKGTMKSSFPMGITLIAPDGTAREELYRALNPERTLKLPMPANEQTGEWTLRVRDLMTGLVAEAKVQVSREAQAAQIVTVGDVFVVEEGKVRQFLKEKPSVDIVLDTRERHLVPEAEGLAALLKKAGLSSRIRVHEPETAPLVWLRWIRSPDDEKLWSKLWKGEVIGVRRNLKTYVGPELDPHFEREHSGYREPAPLHIAMRDMIVLGAPQTNLLLKDIHNAEIAPRRVTENFPGPGRALIQRAWSPFHADYDALMVESLDREGIRKAVNALGRMLRSRKNPPSKRPPSAGGALQRITSAVRKPERFLSGRCGNPITALSYSPDGKEILVGANFYGSNLFCLDSDGNLRWHEHVAHTRINAMNVSGRGITIRSGFATTRKGELGEFKARQLFLDRKGKAQWNCAVEKLVWNRGGTRCARGTGSLLTCYDGAGKVLWYYDDSVTWHTWEDMRALRKVWPLSFSPDGKYLICGALGTIPPYTEGRSKEHKPAILLLDAASGARLWEKRFRVNSGIITPSGILVGGQKVAMYDFDGKRAFNVNLPAATRKVMMSKDGSLLAYQIGQHKDIKNRPVGHCGPVEIAEPPGRPVRLQTEGEVRDFDVAPDATMVAVGTWADKLYVFDRKGKLLWHRDVAGAPLVRFSPDGKTLVAGTSRGVIHLLSSDGGMKSTLDMMEYNLSGDVAGNTRPRSYARKEFPPPDTRRPGAAVARIEKELRLDKNLVTDGNFDKGPGAWKLGKGARIRDNGYHNTKALEIAGGVSRSFEVRPHSDYLVTWFNARDSEDRDTDVVITIHEAGNEKNLLYDGKVACTELWDDVVSVFKTKKARKVTLKLKSRPVEAGVMIDNFRISRIRYPSENYLKTEELDIAKGFDLGKKRGAGVPGKHRDKFLKVTMTVPNTNHYYDPDFLTPLMPAQQLTDGIIFGQDSSWMKANYTLPPYSKLYRIWTRERRRSSYKYHLKGGWVEFELPEPKELSCVVVYEEPGGMIKQTLYFEVKELVNTVSQNMLLKVKEAETGKWRTVDVRINNRHLVNFYTFKPIKASHIAYYISRSEDSHVRCMEVEAYGPAVANIEDEILEKEPEKKKSAEPSTPGFDLGL